MTPDAAMVFAAGLGTRLGHLAKSTPKPLIEVGGRPLIDHALDIAEQAGVGRVVVNVHYMAERLSRHLENRKGVAVSDESGELLETGGGLLKALPLLDSACVFTINSDAVWKGGNPMARLRAAWDPSAMDALLLLAPLPRAVGHRGTGDFVMAANGRIRRCKPGEGGLVYTGAQIIRTAGLAEVGKRVFSLNVAWDGMLERGRLFGIEYSGEFADAGTPQGLELAESLDTVRPAL